MKRRRLAALSLLRRLKKHEMEIINRELGNLRLRSTVLNQQKQSLVDDIQHQTHSVDVALTPYMQRFLPAAKSEIHSLDENIAKLEPHISALEEQVSEGFKEFKTFDIMHNSLSDRMRQDQEAREVETAEEVLLSRWSQKSRCVE
ncbi:MAG: hypothetical protein KUG74_05220 [Rhodobacteraceae bacterium]|nr:hypothetical protein [Paracoccaceae bacterium]